MTMRDQLLRQRSERLNSEQITGGPHDKEFFRCFVTYLDEALTQVVKENQNEQDNSVSSSEEEEASNISNQAPEKQNLMVFESKGLPGERNGASWGMTQQDNFV